MVTGPLIIGATSSSTPLDASKAQSYERRPAAPVTGGPFLDDVGDGEARVDSLDCAPNLPW